jgi:hypothetical protein
MQDLPPPDDEEPEEPEQHANHTAAVPQPKKSTTFKLTSKPAVILCGTKVLAR